MVTNQYCPLNASMDAFAVRVVVKSSERMHSGILHLLVIQKVTGVTVPCTFQNCVCEENW